MSYTPPVRVPPQANTKTGYDIRDRPRNGLPPPVRVPVPEKPVDLRQVEDLATRLQTLAQTLQEHYEYIVYLHQQLTRYAFSSLPTLPPVPAFGPIFPAKSKLTPAAQLTYLEQHATQLDQVLTAHWAYLEKLMAYLDVPSPAERIHKQSLHISLFFPNGNASERLAYMLSLTEKMENIQRSQRTYLEQTRELLANR